MSIRSANNKEKKIMLFGFKLSKHTFRDEFYHEDKHLIEKWGKMMSRFVILTNFGDNFSNIKTLGKGNFARVEKLLNFGIRKSSGPNGEKKNIERDVCGKDI
jgi:hypothetical protein